MKNIKKENVQRAQTLKNKNRVRKGKNGEVEKKKGNDVLPYPSREVGQE